MKADKKVKDQLVKSEETILEGEAALRAQISLLQSQLGGSLDDNLKLRQQLLQIETQNLQLRKQAWAKAQKESFASVGIDIDKQSVITRDGKFVIMDIPQPPKTSAESLLEDLRKD